MNQPPAGSRMSAAMLFELRRFVTDGEHGQQNANDLLAFAIAACVSISQGTADDALAIYQDVIGQLNALLARNVPHRKGPPS
jgi:hypothetical protein